MIKSLIWGGAFMLHPFILRLTSVPIGDVAERAYAAYFSGGSYMRLGKDSFFMVYSSISSLISDSFNKLPTFETYSFLYLMLMGFLWQGDFLAPGAWYQLTFMGFGLIFLKSLYGSLDEKLINTLKNCFLLMGAIGSAWIFLEYFGVKPYRLYTSLVYENIYYKSTHGAGYIAGILNHPNMSGAHLAFCLPFFLGHFRIFSPVILLAIYLCASALPLVTSFMIIAYYFYAKTFTNRLIPFYIVGFFGALFYFTGIGGLDNERFIIWENALDFLKNPLLGDGLGNFNDNFHKLFGPTSNLGKTRHEHSEWLSLYLGYGIVGIFIAYSLLKRAITKARPMFACGLFGVFVNSYGNHPFHLSTLAVPAIFFYAACLYDSQGAISE